MVPFPKKEPLDVWFLIVLAKERQCFCHVAFLINITECNCILMKFGIMHPFEAVTYSLHERVAFLPRDRNICSYGQITKVLDDNMYSITPGSSLGHETVDLSVEEMMKFPSLKKNDDDITNPLLHILFNGNDDINLEKIFKSINKTLLENYLDVLKNFDGEEYFEYNLCKNTANMITLQILSFINLPKNIWKLPCLSCEKTIKISQQKKQSILLIRFTHQWVLERIHFYRCDLLYDKSWHGKMACALCFRFICDNELVFSCSLKRHGLCFECYYAIANYFTLIHNLLNSLLTQSLNQDCIYSIVTFVAGEIKLVQNISNCVPWTATFAT
ncbi:hypothetical protein RFI_35738 [Reticulomyxa filosa]|uniref:Uncharacterized protein n=1 Tax=Reticulomyxa filosa TaxID=46433 RepID=X6LJZ9_RETFI|nr:hypothetical protein RFI_35738 [Reticulomyxa filosa]|eukprot:ETO01701.1 hypothetical protein RFI_35738 [Reticulomyxa filosa]